MPQSILTRFKIESEEAHFFLLFELLAAAASTAVKILAATGSPRTRWDQAQIHRRGRLINPPQPQSLPHTQELLLRSIPPRPKGPGLGHQGR